MSPKPNRKMTFEEWMEEEANRIKFDPGDTAESLPELGEQVNKEIAA